MYTFLIFLILAACTLMVLVILAQQSKGGAAGQFSGSNANQMIGAPQKMDTLERITWGFISAVFVLVLFSNFFIQAGSTKIENTNLKEAQKKKVANPEQKKQEGTEKKK